MDFNDLKESICAVVELAIQPVYSGFDNLPVRPLIQVTLRPEKIKDGMIRLGETPGDEALCWVRAKDINIVSVLGRAIPANSAAEAWRVEPLPKEKVA